MDEPCCCLDTTKSEADRISVYLNGSKLDLVGSQKWCTQIILHKMQNSCLMFKL